MTNGPSDGDCGRLRCKGGIVVEGKIHVDEDGLCAVYLAEAAGDYRKGDFYPIRWDDVEEFQKLSL
jgi:hypothetical protein